MLYCKDFKKTERKYRFFIRTYYTFQDCLTLIDILKDSNYLLHYAIIEHNKDNVTHSHMLLTFKQPISALNIYNRLSLVSELYDQNTEFEIPNSLLGCYEYLYHKNEIDKIPYNEFDIVCDNVSYFTKTNDNLYKKNLEFIDDLLELDYMSMAIKYGRDYIKNYSSYNSFKHLLQDKVDLD